MDGGRGRGGDPGNLADAHDYYALYLAAVGRHTEDGAEGRRARELDPLSLIILVDTAWVQYLARDYDQAIEINRKVLDMDPTFWPALRISASPTRRSAGFRRP